MEGPLSSWRQLNIVRELEAIENLPTELVTTRSLMRTALDPAAWDPAGVGFSATGSHERSAPDAGTTAIVLRNFLRFMIFPPYEVFFSSAAGWAIQARFSGFGHRRVSAGYPENRDPDCSQEHSIVNHHPFQGSICTVLFSASVIQQ